MITTGISIQAFMGGIGLAFSVFFVTCLLTLGAAIIRSLASDGAS